MSQKSKIEIQEFVSIHVDETNKTPFISTSLFIGNSDESVLDSDIPLEAIVQKFIDDNSIPNPGGKSNTVNDKYKDYLLSSLDEMILVLEKAKKKINKMPQWKSKNG